MSHEGPGVHITKEELFTEPLISEEYKLHSQISYFKDHLHQVEDEARLLQQTVNQLVVEKEESRNLVTKLTKELEQATVIRKWQQTQLSIFEAEKKKLQKEIRTLKSMNTEEKRQNEQYEEQLALHGAPKATIIIPAQQEHVFNLYQPNKPHAQLPQPTVTSAKKNNKKK